MKTTAQDFKAFQRYCRKWQKRFGLTAYKLFFEHKEDDEAIAWAVSDPENGTALLGFNTDWIQDWPKTHKEIETTAMHEIGEVLLCEIRELLVPHHSTKVINHYIHDVVRRLEHLLFP